VESGRARASDRRRGAKWLSDVIEHESITKAALTSPLRAFYKQYIRIFIFTTHTLFSHKHTQSTRCTEHTACARLARLRRRRFRTRPLRRPRRRADVSLARPTLVRHATNVCALRVFSTASSTLAGCDIFTCHRRHLAHAMRKRATVRLEGMYLKFWIPMLRFKASIEVVLNANMHVFVQATPSATSPRAPSVPTLRRSSHS
jgi:hypothetical protein